MPTPRRLTLRLCLALAVGFTACDDDDPPAAPGPADGGAPEVMREANPDEVRPHADAPQPEGPDLDAADPDASEAGGDGGVGEVGPSLPIVQEPGTLAVIAGAVGIARARDGDAGFARWGEIQDMTFDPVARRFYLIDHHRSDRLLRSFDLATNTVRTITRGLASEDIAFQNGFLFALLFEGEKGPGVAKLAPEDGRMLQHYPLTGPRTHCIAAAPDGNRIYLGRGDDTFEALPFLHELDPATGIGATLTLSGQPFEKDIEACEMAPDGRLLFWMTYYQSYEDPSVGVPESQLLSVELGSRRIDLVRRFARTEQPEFHSYLRLDPGGQFVGGNTYFYRFGPIGPAIRLPPRDFGYGMVRDGQDLYVGRGYVLERRPGGTGEPIALVGLPEVPRTFNQPGPGRRTRPAALRMATAGDSAYLATAFGYYERYALLRVDLSNGDVHEAVPQSDPATGALAVATASDGTLFAARTGSAGCEIRRLAPGAAATTLLFTSRAGCAAHAERAAGLMYTPVGMAHAAGHLYLVQQSLDAVQDIDLATGAATDLPGTSAIVQPTDIAAGSDGKLYVLSRGTIFRVDPRVGGASPFATATAGFSIAADGRGHLFASQKNTVVSFDLATGAATTVVGRTEVNDVITGPLPGALLEPGALAAGPAGDLLLLDRYDIVLLRARF